MEIAEENMGEQFWDDPSVSEALNLHGSGAQGESAHLVWSLRLSQGETPKDTTVEGLEHGSDLNTNKG